MRKRKVQIYCAITGENVTIEINEQVLHNGNGPDKKIISNYCSKSFCNESRLAHGT